MTPSCFSHWPRHWSSLTLYTPGVWGIPLLLNFLLSDLLSLESCVYIFNLCAGPALSFFYPIRDLSPLFVFCIARPSYLLWCSRAFSQSFELIHITIHIKTLPLQGRRCGAIASWHWHDSARSTSKTLSARPIYMMVGNLDSKTLLMPAVSIVLLYLTRWWLTLDQLASPRYALQPAGVTVINMKTNTSI